MFAGGIGEKGAEFRKMVVEKVACLGFEIDEGRNGDPGESVVVDIGKEKEQEGKGKGNGRVLVCKTDEQFEMARGCAAEARTFKEEQK